MTDTLSRLSRAVRTATNPQHVDVPTREEEIDAFLRWAQPQRRDEASEPEHVQKLEGARALMNATRPPRSAGMSVSLKDGRR